MKVKKKNVSKVQIPESIVASHLCVVATHVPSLFLQSHRQDLYANEIVCNGIMSESPDKRLRCVFGLGRKLQQLAAAVAEPQGSPLNTAWIVQAEQLLPGSVLAHILPSSIHSFRNGRICHPFTARRALEADVFTHPNVFHGLFFFPSHLQLPLYVVRCVLFLSCIFCIL